MVVTSLPKIVHQGIDTLVLGVKSTDELNFNTIFKPFVERVKLAKEYARAANTYGDKVYKTNLGLKFGDFFVKSRGHGSYVGYVYNNDILFNVADVEYDAKSLYHVKLQFRSTYLIKYGHEYCYQQVSEFLSAIFGGSYLITVLRLDLCTDVAGIKYTPIDFLNFRSFKKISNFNEATAFTLKQQKMKTRLGLLY